MLLFQTMRFRLGFVSNSSAASFCIYGWTFEQLEPYGINRWEVWDLIKLLQEEYPEMHFRESSTPDSDWILGVGDSQSEFDHYYDGDWTEYESSYPKKEEMEDLDKIAAYLKWPKPELKAATWFDG
jgi:hypothetical protein